jgi:hypothetical protein
MIREVERHQRMNHIAFLLAKGSLIALSLQGTEIRHPLTPSMDLWEKTMSLGDITCSGEQIGFSYLI